MAITTWVQAAATVLLGLVGLWFAHNCRRQIRLELAERQVDSYMRLWTLIAAASAVSRCWSRRNGRSAATT